MSELANNLILSHTNSCYQHKFNLKKKLLFLNRLKTIFLLSDFIRIPILFSLNLDKLLRYKDTDAVPYTHNALRPASFLESSGKYQMFREKGNQSFSSPPGAVKPDPGDFDLIPPDF